MQRKLKIKLKPFSVNSMYYSTKKLKAVRTVKTADYREWCNRVFYQLEQYNNNLKKMEELRNFFDPKIHCFHVTLKHHYPDHILFKQDGSLSSYAHDLSNIEKPIIDCIFLPKHFNRKVPNGVKNVKYDDKYIKKLSSEKLMSKDDNYYIEIYIQIKNLDYVNPKKYVG